MKAEDIERIWYGNAPVPWWLQALVPVYRFLSGARRKLWRSGLCKPQRLPLPVLVVGNLTVGGTGKTPLVIALVEGLREHGLRAGVVSRGYGGSSRGPLLLGDQPDPRFAGDEPCLIRTRTGAPVAIGRNRPAAARLLLDQGVDCIISDDGLQNPSLARDIELCVIDGERRFGNGRLLPAGPLREELTRLQRVDHVICNGGAVQDHQIPMRLRGRMAVSLLSPEQSRPLSEFIGSPVHAVAAIGNPHRFFLGLRARDLEVVEHAFPDHHAFTAVDLAFGDDHPVLMTEKDAVKCRPFAKPQHWVVPVSAELPQAFLRRIAQRIQALRRSRFAGGAITQEH